MGSVTPFARRVSFREVKAEDERSLLLPKAPRAGKRLSSAPGPGPWLSLAGDADVGWPEKHPGAWDLPPPPRHSLEPCGSCVKYLAAFWNLVFSGLGLLLLAFGVWGLLDKESLGSERVAHLGSDPMLFCVLLGLAVSTVSLAGCLGALCENPCLLKFFTGGVVAFVLLETLGGLVLYSQRHQVRGSLLLAVQRYQDDPDLRFLMDELQAGLQCCGVETYRDWARNLYFNCSSPGVQACGVPASCCLHPRENGTITNSQCGFGALGLQEFQAQSLVYLGGCLPELSRWLRGHRGALSACVVLLVLLEVGSLLLVAKLLAELALVRAQPRGAW